MNEIGMTPKNPQAVEVPDSSIEEQIKSLHESLDVLDAELVLLEENLSGVMCTTIPQGVNCLSETPVMSRVAEKIFAAQSRVGDTTLFINRINKNLNIEDK